MAITVNDKDLGMVTAYAYALAGGYTGTEAEFEALLGKIAEDLAEIENLSVQVQTLPAGSDATASYAEGVLTLGIPRGDKGETGDQGEIGPTPQLSVGTVTTGAPGTDAEVEITGTPEAPVLNFTIPRGDTGNITQAVRYDAAQTLTDAQKEQARANIDAADAGEVAELKSAINGGTFTFTKTYISDNRYETNKIYDAQSSSIGKSFSQITKTSTTGGFSYIFDVTLSKEVSFPIGTPSASTIYGNLAFDENDICVWTWMNRDTTKTAGDVITVTLPKNAVKLLMAFPGSLNNLGTEYVVTLKCNNALNEIGKTELQVGKNETSIGKIDILDLFEIGEIAISNSGWIYTVSPYRVRTKKGITLSLKPGDVVGLTDYTGARYYTGYKKTDGTYGYYSWRTSDLMIEYEGEYVFNISNTPDDAPNTKPDTLAALFKGYKGVAFESIKANTDNIVLSNTVRMPLTNGYLSSVGGGIEAQTSAKEVTTDFIPVVNGMNFTLRFVFPESKSMWVACCEYDSRKALIGSRSVMLSNATVEKINLYKTISTSGAKYIRFSYRTYDSVDAAIITDGTAVLQYEIDDLHNADALNGWMLNQNINGVNHRGFNTCPENTLIAFKESRLKGFGIVETDVRFTSDGVPVLLHDESINRTARNADGTSISSTVNIADITYAQSQDYDFGIYKGSAFSGTKIPKFEDFLKLCRSIGLKCYIELKAGTQAQIESLVDLVKQNGMDGKVSWISAALTYINYINDYDETARVGFISIDLSSVLADTILGWKTGQNEVFADLYFYDSGISESIENAKAVLLPVEVWTVNTSSAIISMDSYITGVTSDNLIAGKVLFENGIK